VLSFRQVAAHVGVNRRRTQLETKNNPSLELVAQNKRRTQPEVQLGDEPWPTAQNFGSDSAWKRRWANVCFGWKADTSLMSARGTYWF
jgi:hypothetical protein